MQANVLAQMAVQSKTSLRPLGDTSSTTHAIPTDDVLNVMMR